MADLAHLELAAGLGQGLLGQGALEQALYRGHQQGTGPAGQLGQDGQALLLPLAAGGAGVEEKVPRREDGDLFAQKGAQVPGGPAGLGVVRADQDQGTLGILTERSGEVGPVDGGQAGQGERAFALGDGLPQAAVIRQPVQQTGQQGGGTGRGHGKPSFSNSNHNRRRTGWVSR